MSSVNAHFGKVVRQARQAQRWSQEHLAASANLNRSYLGEIERSAVTPSLATVEKLAQALGISVSVLIGRCEGLVLAAVRPPYPGAAAGGTARTTSNGPASKQGIGAAG